MKPSQNVQPNLRSKSSKMLQSLLAAALLSAFALLAAGCSSTPEDSQLPWGRPANWEGGIPGLGVGGVR